MRTAILLVSALMLIVPAAAQNTEPTKPDPCQAQPQENAQQNGQDKQPESKDNGSTAQKLAPCGGVLTPPPTGDSEMTAPAPGEGKTPVLKPGEVPAQPPKQD